MLKIADASTDKKYRLIMSTLQALVCGSINNENLASDGTSFGLEVSRNINGWGNHLSFKMSRLKLLPTYQLYPSRTIDCATKILHHANDGRFPSSADRKSLLGK